MQNLKIYRPGVGIVLLNKEGKIFGGKRIEKDSLDLNLPWQMPQGGIEEGEDTLLAAKRELYEETGAKSVKIVENTDWLYYDLPKEAVANFWNGKYVGQKQIWYKMLFLGDDTEFSLTHDVQEFSEWKWCETDFLLKNIVDFKRDLYGEIFRNFNLK